MIFNPFLTHHSLHNDFFWKGDSYFSELDFSEPFACCRECQPAHPDPPWERSWFWPESWHVELVTFPQSLGWRAPKKNCSFLSDSCLDQWLLKSHPAVSLLTWTAFWNGWWETPTQIFNPDLAAFPPPPPPPPVGFGARPLFSSLYPRWTLAFHPKGDWLFYQEVKWQTWSVL